jgi:Ca2+-binding RTX toxin-like protein
MITDRSILETDTERAVTLDRVAVLPEGGIAPLARIDGTPGNDSLTGTDGDDAIRGGRGNDTLEGGFGIDSVFGGDGNDRLVLTEARGEDLLPGEVLDGGKGWDKILLAPPSVRPPFANYDYDLRQGTLRSIEEIEFTGPDNTNRTLLLASHQFGSGGLSTSLRIDPWPGAVTRLELHLTEGQTVFDATTWDLEGWQWFSTIIFHGSAAGDTITGTSERDRIFGGDGDDTLFGGSRFNEMFGGNGNDTIFGGSANGGNGDDLIIGSESNGVMVGGEGHDTLDLSLDATWRNIDLITGKSLVTIDGEELNRIRERFKGFETLLLGAGNDKGLGTDGNDTLSGGNGDDTLEGRGGDDRILGGKGDDWLADGSGTDRLAGGAGADIFDLATDGAVDRITDFEDGIDLIRFVGQSFAALTISDLTPGRVRIEVAGDVLILRDGDAGTLTAADLTEADFLFS